VRVYFEVVRNPSLLFVHSGVRHASYGQRSAGDRRLVILCHRGVLPRIGVLCGGLKTRRPIFVRCALLTLVLVRKRAMKVEDSKLFGVVNKAVQGNVSASRWWRSAVFNSAGSRGGCVQVF